MSEQIMWAVFRKGGRVVASSVRTTRRDAIEAATGRPWAWESYERRGYTVSRIRLVRITEVPNA